MFSRSYHNKTPHVLKQSIGLYSPVSKNTFIKTNPQQHHVQPATTLRAFHRVSHACPDHRVLQHPAMPPAFSRTGCHCDPNLTISLKLKIPDAPLPSLPFLKKRRSTSRPIVVKTFDDGSKARSFGHALVAGIDRAPLKVTRRSQRVTGYESWDNQALFQLDAHEKGLCMSKQVIYIYIYIYILGTPVHMCIYKHRLFCSVAISVCTSTTCFCLKSCYY